MNPCTKNCEDCRERSGCRLCEAYSDNCPIAKCCREKGHENCSTCTDFNICTVRRSCYSMPKYRLEKAEEERIREERYRSLREIVLKYLRPLFVISLITEILSLLPTGTDVIEKTPAMRFPIAAVLLVLRLALGIILVKLGSVNDRYKKAGALTVIYAFASAVITMFRTPQTSDSMSVLALIISVIVYISIYLEYTAHSDIFAGVDDSLGEKWTNLFKWKIAATLTTAAAPILVLFASVLGAIVTLLALLAAVVTDVLYFVYLNSTIRDFTYEEL